MNEGLTIAAVFALGMLAQGLFGLLVDWFFESRAERQHKRQIAELRRLYREQRVRVHLAARRPPMGIAAWWDAGYRRGKEDALAELPEREANAGRVSHALIADVFGSEPRR